MKKIDFKKQILPHLLVVLAFLALVFIYFSPVFMQHKELIQGDIEQWKGGAEEITKFRKETGIEPLWTGAMFSGMPSAFVSTMHFGDIYSHIHTILTVGLPHPVSLIFIMLVSFYLLLLAFDIKPLLASIGAVGFALASFTIISLAAGHNAKVMAIAYMPMALAGAIWAYRKNPLAGAALFGLGFAMQIRASHLQITYYLALMLVIFGISELIFSQKSDQLAKFIKTSVFLVVFGLVAVACNLGQILTNYEYSKYSIRGKYELTPLDKTTRTNTEGLDKAYAFEYSIAESEALTLLVPNFVGGNNSVQLDEKSATYKALSERGASFEQIQGVTQHAATYFGGLKGTAGPSYAGAVICFLFVLGLFIVEARWKWWIVAATLLAVLLSMGSYLPSFNYFMFDYFPGYNKFRAVTMAICIAQITIPLLAILAVDKLLKSNVKDIEKDFIYAIAITAGLCLIIAFSGSVRELDGAADAQYKQMVGSDWLVNAIKEDRISVVKKDAFRSLIFILLAAGIIYAYIKNFVKAVFVVPVLLALTVFDLWNVDRRYLDKDNFQSKDENPMFIPSAADNAILADKDPNYRVLNLGNPFADARTSFFHKSIGGYCAAKMRRYQDLIERQLTPELEKMYAEFNGQKFTYNSLANYPVINMLNTKYLKASEEAGGVIPNQYACGNAWFVPTLKPVNSPDEEIAAITSFNPKNEAFIDVKKFPINKFNFDTVGAKISLVNYKPNEVNYTSSVNKEGFAVFSEVFYDKGWTATIDGKETPIVRVNYILRGLQVPAGKHVIAFKFRPESYYLGNKIGLAASVLLLLAVIAILYLQTKKEEEKAAV